MANTLSASEEAQLTQTIEMFEVITQSQPQDYQSLEILKEAYSKLGREDDVISASKRIAQAYVQMGQLSSAILEYETILQRHPEDPDVQTALKEIETRANNFPIETVPEVPPPPKNNGESSLTHKTPGRAAPADVDDGRRSMLKHFVDPKIISASDFDLCWPKPDLGAAPVGVVEPFVQVLADKGILAVEKSLRILSDKSRCAFLSLKHYDMDVELARKFPAATCQRWCVLPVDRMSKSVLVATANPFNQQAAKELAAVNGGRLLWYLVPPAELANTIRKVFR